MSRDCFFFFIDILHLRDINVTLTPKLKTLGTDCEGSMFIYLSSYAS